MTNTEALHWCEDFQINIIREVRKMSNRHKLALDAMDRAKEAITRRIPVEPAPFRVNCDSIQIGHAKWRKGTTVYKCPCCDNFVSRIQKYCFTCGQALDWGETDDNS